VHFSDKSCNLYLKETLNEYDIKNLDEIADERETLKKK